MSIQTARGDVMVVDDEDYVRNSIAAILIRRGYRVRTAATAAEALREHALDGVDVVLTDLKLSDSDGRTLLTQVRANEPGTPVIVLTGYGTVSSAVACMQAGASDYLLKPADPDALVLVIERAISGRNMRRELDYLRAGGDRSRPERERAPIGRSSAWMRVLELVDAAAPTDATVLLLGQSGTGKGEVARLLHEKSRRAKSPLVRVNCAAIPTELFESEFFGHRRGAFSGAISDREGRFRIAHRGTLFLDEIGTLPESAQAKVLRVLEDGEFERIGESQSTVVDVRLIAATNADLPSEVQDGRFRSDLFYRLNVMTIHLPPLSERRDDIPALSAHFLSEIRPRLAKQVDAIHPDTMAALMTYAWPGNIRELRNVIERALIIERTDRLLPTSLPDGFVETTPESISLDLRKTIAATERRTLELALRQAAGVKREAARLLGIDERNLSYYLKKHDLMGSRR